MRPRYLSFLLFIISRLYAYQNFHGCCLAPDNLTGWVVTIDSIIVLKTTDGGAHWFEQPNNAAGRKFFDITCRDNLKVWTCGILGEITHTNNGGQTWIHQVQGLAKYATRVEFIDDTLGWAVCGDGVVGRTTDGGSYWEQIFTPYAQAEFYGVSFVDAYEGWVVAGWPDSLDIAQGKIVHTTDGGFNWDSLYFSPIYEDFFDVYFFNNTNGIVVGGNEQDYSPIIWKTTNSGNTWDPIQTPANAYYLRALDFVDNLNGWAVGRFGTIIRTTDGGNSWTFQNNPATTTLFDVDFSDAFHGIACGYNIILYTTNGGNTWNIGEVPGIKEVNKWELESGKLEIYPNPFRAKIEIRYRIQDAGYRIGENGVVSSQYPVASKNEVASSQYPVVSIRIYDISGRLVKSFSLTTDYCVLGTIVWDGTDDADRRLPSGVYFIRLETDEFKKNEKVILLR